MDDPLPHNNELSAAEKSLRRIGSNVWFGGLSEEWQDYLISHTVETFDTYDMSMEKAASVLIQAYQEMVRFQPAVLDVNPWLLNDEFWADLQEYKHNS
ncbi:hypothetical protein BZG13_00370 [Salinivibrio sp. ML323]|uniref:hypothetical protein n=1 Tax=Salinivibrio sp. ML323 TaxID=1909474 RepID=UPI0009875344|nr:hypothetical protein [Salinivibrio sp. ML323]OOE60285.1 hypothetical protein BZG13_00370 [Salinivibrio sp. ML323]